MFEVKGKYTTAKVMIDEVDSETLKQIHEFVSHEAYTNDIAVMPDCHAGKGAVVGFTMPMSDKIVPNCVGVDIGCGVLGIDVGSRLFEKVSKEQLDAVIRDVIPFGMEVRKTVHPSFSFSSKDLNGRLRVFVMEWNRTYNDNKGLVVYGDNWLQEVCHRIHAPYDRCAKSLGSLGGGNHYCEIGKSENTGNYWITIHSGSRNFGKTVAEYWQDIARNSLTAVVQSKSEYTKWVKENFSKDRWNLMISAFKETRKSVAKGTEYLEGENMFGYLTDMVVAQYYAEINRQLMKQSICEALDVLGVSYDVLDEVSTTHNFIDFNDWVIRKGAIRSYVGERMCIPFNPKDGLLICEGKSNAEWNYSAPHGAGRVLSRSQAKAQITKAQAKKAMEGVYTSVLPLDESPLAYKSAVTIEKCIEDTAIILDRVRPVMNLKSEG